MLAPYQIRNRFLPARRQKMYCHLHHLHFVLNSFFPCGLESCFYWSTIKIISLDLFLYSFIQCWIFVYFVYGGSPAYCTHGKTVYLNKQNQWTQQFKHPLIPFNYYFSSLVFKVFLMLTAEPCHQDKAHCVPPPLHYLSLKLNPCNQRWRQICSAVCLHNICCGVCFILPHGHKYLCKTFLVNTHNPAVFRWIEMAC